MTERCGCDESIALRRELEAGTVAMYRARARDAERARDEMAREVALLGRQLADLTAATDAEANAAAWQSEELERRRERDEARAQLAALRSEVSEAFGVPTGIGPAPGEIARLVREHREMVMRCGEAADYMAADDERIARLEAQLAALRSEVHDVLAEPHAYIGGRERSVLACAIGAADAAAEAHDRRVRAEVLRLAADRLSAQPVTAGLLREWADEIEIELGER